VNGTADRPHKSTFRLTRRRRLHRASNAAILSLATVGIVVLLNVLAARYYKRFDVTQGRLHSLSPQSLQVLDELDDKTGRIEVIGFYPDGQGQKSFETWLDEYRAHTQALDYRMIDPIRQPGETERLGWDAFGAGLLVRRGERSQEVFFPDEQDITSALLKVSRDAPKDVYFLSGHNERSPADYEAAGYGGVGALLEENNYRVRTLNLALTEDIPSDAALLVIAGPRRPLLSDEARRIRDYLLDGGKALILVDPGLATEPGSDRAGWIDDINELLEPWQVRFADATVVDPQQSLGGDPLAPAWTDYGFHQITKDLDNTLIALPLAAPILLPPAPDEARFRFSVLAMTSEQSWAESDLQADPLQYDGGQTTSAGGDLPGPLVVAVAVESSTETAGGQMMSADKPTRLVLIGDSDLARNDVLDQIPNGQFLLLNAVNWLAEEEALIAIGPKTSLQSPGQRPSIRLNRRQEALVSLGALVLLPLAIVVAGVIVWSRRRRPRPTGGNRS
jgi:ABC-type uncharacterized transport system involved in gliding motility auxiliary subunit